MISRNRSVCSISILVFLFLFGCKPYGFAQIAETPADKALRMSWWKDAKFGLFIHWGAYSVAAGEYNGQKNYGEWLMYEAKVPIPEYEKLASRLNPQQFNATEWVRMAKKAGMKYIVITSKHHDGFGMFDSKVSDYDIMDRTSFHRDPLRELADACRKEGLKLCFYYSIMDWHHPLARKADFARYRDEYMMPQLKELLTNYGDIGVLWFDGEWIDEWTEDQGKALYSYVRGLQPNIIINNRVGKGRNGMQGMNSAETAAGDFGTPEQEILSEKSSLDWESCMTMNDHWGYCKNDKNFKSAQDLIWNLVDITAKGGNFLLNVGPTAEGEFPPESVDRLKVMGDWMSIHAAAIYSSKPWAHWQEGENVRYAEGKDGVIYVFFRNVEGESLLLKKIRPISGSRVYQLGKKKPLHWAQTEEGVQIQLPATLGRNETGVIRMKGLAVDLSAPPKIEDGQKSMVFAGSTNVHLYTVPGADIFYTIDGSEPTLHSPKYLQSFPLTESGVIKAIALSPGKKPSETVQTRFIKAKYGVEYRTNYSEKYTAQGPLSLVDGVHGSPQFTDGNWLGYEGVNFSVRVDLGEQKWLDTVGISFLRNLPSWIFLPEKLEFFQSNDGIVFQPCATQNLPKALELDENTIQTYLIPLKAQCRYLMIYAKNPGVCPPWHPGAGGKSWLFVDEVWVHERTAGANNHYEMVPKPVSLKPQNGVFALIESVQWSDPGLTPSFFHQYFNQKYGLVSSVAQKNPADAVFQDPKLGIKDEIQPASGLFNKKAPGQIIYARVSPDSLPEEGYTLTIAQNRVTISASTDKGFFYADQTLIQLAELNSQPGEDYQLPCVSIMDAPRFGWRGMHLDESRHFFGKAFVEQYIDHLASLKMNVFHWHLTDAPGWRIEIKKYPKLTAIGAWRPDRTGILNSDADTAKVGEPMTYGGFYTQEDIREIVAYAAARQITVLPEIEMPGHTTAALVAYPEYSCSGGPFPMPGGAKNAPYPNFCVGNDSTMRFILDILTEVMGLFPSAYIHIGGDEVERSQWQQCPRCQARKTALGLSDDAQLQVDFTKRIEDFIRSKGRQLMGWDEIMEGGNLSPSAGVMVWRGEPLLREATAAGHQVVVTHNYYFDLYQGNPQYEPITYGYKPLKEVYTYEPVPVDLSEAQKKLILGVQGCLWSENLYKTKDVEYMLFPRLLALAEVAWTPENDRNWVDFTQRLPAQFSLLERKDVHFSTSVYNPYPIIRYDSTLQGLVCQFEQQIPRGSIHYTLSKNRQQYESATYAGPVKLTQAASIRARAYVDARPIGAEVSLEYRPSLASGKPFQLKYLPASQYNGNRPETLTDGLTGSAAFHDGNWCGFYGDDIDLNIDLEKSTSIQSIGLNLLEATGSWIFLPTKLVVEISDDGIHFTPIAQQDQVQLAALNQERIKKLVVPLSAQKARFIHVFAQNPGPHPTIKDGKCWLFMDEVQVLGNGQE